MNRLNLMISIMDRDRLPEFIGLYREKNSTLHFVSLGRGTASNEILGYFGLSGSEKAVCFSTVTDEIFKQIKKTLQQRFKIDVPGTGIVFTVPISSIGGMRELNYLTDGLNYKKGEESAMKDTTHELIVVISNQGYSGTVIEAAKAGGAGGGTVIHAQGAGRKEAEKLLGFSLASEKEMLFIVTTKNKKNTIMESVMKSAGLETEAKAIVFSVPVSATAGLRLMEPENEFVDQAEDDFHA